MFDGALLSLAHCHETLPGLPVADTLIDIGEAKKRKEQAWWEIALRSPAEGSPWFMRRDWAPF